MPIKKASLHSKPIPAVYCPGTGKALPKLFRKLPGDDCRSPRDGLRLHKTEDILFLAALLHRAGNARYLLQLADGAIIPEPPGADGLAGSEQAQVKSRISRATVRRWFRDRFFVTRRLLANGKVPGHTIRFMGKELKSARRWKPNQPWALGKSLKWPFEKGHDTLLSELHKIPLLSWQETRPLEKGELYCPLDGPLTPVKSELISPPITWEHMVGRHWRTLLCPNCLGEFKVDLVGMN